MYVLFLDFDGVLITWRSHAARSNWDLNTSCPDVTIGKFLEKLFHYSTHIPLKLVISSSWRFNEVDCKDVLEQFNLIQYLHPDWRTTVYGNNLSNEEVVVALDRGGEIQEWLNRHTEVKEYKILDDYPLTMFPEKQHRNLIHCDGVDGLGGRDMRRLVNWIIPANKLGIW